MAVVGLAVAMPVALVDADERELRSRGGEIDCVALWDGRDEDGHSVELSDESIHLAAYELFKPDGCEGSSVSKLSNVVHGVYVRDGTRVLGVVVGAQVLAPENNFPFSGPKVVNNLARLVAG